MTVRKHASEMMQCMEDAVLHCHPRDVYASMVCHDSLDAPCDVTTAVHCETESASPKDRRSSKDLT